MLRRRMEGATDVGYRFRVLTKIRGNTIFPIEENTMSRKRIAAFITMYAFIVAAMLLVYFFVQREYGADLEGPYERRFLMRLPLLERADSRCFVMNFD